MTSVHFHWGSGQLGRKQLFVLEVAQVPRVGEEVRINDSEFAVARVRHTVRYSEQNAPRASDTIDVFLETMK